MTLSINQPTRPQLFKGRMPNPGALGGTAIPWDARLSQNQLMNRLFIESVGSFPWTLAFSRNKYERIENALAIASYLVIGIAAPLGMGWLFNNKFSKWLTKKHDLTPGAKPLKISFQHLEHQGYQKLTQNTPKDTAAKILKKYGIPDAKHFTPQLVSHIKRAKIGIVFVDLLLLAIKGQVFWFGKNWMTEKLSGKSGFSGEFGYTSEAYRKKKSEKYDKNKTKRFIISSVLGFGSAILFPFMLLGVLNNKAQIGKGLVGKMKSLLPKFDYSNAIYMSKWLLLYETLFNYNLPKLMSSRDSHEFRENFSKSLAFDSFYFIGDGIFAGLAARYLQKKYADRLDDTKLHTTHQKFGLKIPSAISYDKLFEAEGKVAPLTLRLSRISFWTGLLATTACLSIFVPLLNMYYTKKKATKEQAAFNQKPSAPPPIAPQPAKVILPQPRITPQPSQPTYAPFPLSLQPNLPLFQETFNHPTYPFSLGNKQPQRA